MVLAEDDHELRALLSEELRKDGYQVEEVEDGWQLIELLRSWLADKRSNPIDLIISDNRMPGRDGLSVLRALRQFDSAIPLVLITAFGEEETHREARLLGAIAVFDKPFDLAALRALLLKTLPRR